MTAENAEPSAAPATVPAAAVVDVAGPTDGSAQDRLAAEVSSLEIAKDSQQQPQPDAIPPHRSHDPQYNQKRSDPFQFGSRYLGRQDDVFEFNAWDHVETDDTYKEYAEQQYAMQRQAPVSDFDKSELSFFSSAEVSFLAGSTTAPPALVMIYNYKHSSSEFFMKTPM